MDIKLLAPIICRPHCRDHPGFDGWRGPGCKSCGPRIPLLITWLLLGGLFVALGGGHLPPALAADAVSSPAAYTAQTDTFGITLRLIPGGTYLIGSPPEEAGRYWHEGPQHKVRLAPFYITDKEVTNAQYGRFLAATGHRPPLYWLDQNLNAPQQPVVGVTWQDAMDFAKWLSQVTGKEYRLPTEAEWEAACRGGLAGQPFPWGSQPPEQDGRFLANYNPKPRDKDGFPYAAPVGSFPPNGCGLYDMAGNVAEWCLDWYDPTYYSRSQFDNPMGAPTGTYRIIRGGSWYTQARELRCAARQFFRPSRADGFIGFRLVSPVSR